MGGFWNGLWLTAAFLSECAALAALALGGWSLPAPVPLRFVAAVGMPLAAAVLWGLVAAPRAPVRHRAAAALVKVVVLGSGVLALVLTGHPVAAGVLAVLSFLGAVLPASAVPRVSDPSAG